MSAFSYNDVLKLIPEARPRKFPEPQCDPVLDHCVKLRKFHDEIEHLILLTSNLKEVYDDFEREPILKSLPPVPELPELIKKTPNKKEKSLAIEDVELSEDSVVKLVSKSIAYVLFMLGYTDMSSHLLKMFSKVIIDFVKSLIEMMVKLLPEEGFISLDLLETALQGKGIDGIEELHSFYTQRIVKFHDSLYLKCERLCDDLKNNLKKPDAPPKKNITASSVDEQCSVDVCKEKQNIEASTEDSNKYSLDTGVLAEDLFVHKKMKQKSVRFAPPVAMCEISNHKDNQGNFHAKNAAHSGTFSNQKNMLTEKDNTVSFEYKNFDSNLSIESTSAVSKSSSKVNGIFSNHFYYCDDETLDNSTSIVSGEKNPVCCLEDEPSNHDIIIVDTKIEPNKNAIGSELIDELLDQHAIVSDATDKNAIDSELIEESSDGDASIVPDKGKALDINAMSSELINELVEQDANIVCDKDKVTDKNAIECELIEELSERDANELSDQDANIVSDEDKVTDKKAIDCELNEESSEKNASIFSYKEEALDINAMSSELIDELSNQDVNIVSDGEKFSDKNAMNCKLIEESSEKDASIVPDDEEAFVENGIGSESYSNLKKLFSENTFSCKDTKPISDFSGELNNAVSKYSTKISVCFSNDKPLQNRNAKKKLVDLENLDSLCDNSTGNRKKRPKLMKLKKVPESDTSMEVMPPKMRDDVKNFEHSSSITNCDIDSEAHIKELGTISEENSFYNSHNPKANLHFETKSVANDCGENINSMLDASSSSENETEQIWVSL